MSRNSMVNDLSFYVGNILSGNEMPPFNILTKRMTVLPVSYIAADIYEIELCACII